MLLAALCSDLANYPVSVAVAASAAVPVVFAPVVVQELPRRLPGAASPLHRAAATERRRCCGTLPADVSVSPGRSPLRVKLLDGGIVEPITGLPVTIARLASDTLGRCSPKRA